MKFSRLVSKAIDGLYIAPVNKVMPLQTFRYGACGSINMVVNLVLYYIVYNMLLGQRDLRLGTLPCAGGCADIVVSAKIAAGCIVFPVIFLTGFWLNKHVAFKHSPLRNRTQLLRYLLSVAGSLLLYYLCMTFFVDVCGIWATPAYALQIIITTFYSYLMQKYFSFRGCAEI